MQVIRGMVYLIGAGPGDPELLTLKAVRALGRADVVMIDDLVDRRVLEFAPAARVIEVGKRGGCKSTPQAFIERLMVRLARRGNIVARVKGGDPFVFGRGGEEALALAQAGIACEVIPGITAGIGVPAALGIPVTHRGMARGVTFITGHTRDGAGPDWAALARTDTTLVIYMGMQRVAAITSALRAAGMADTTPAAVIQHGTTELQRHVIATLATLADAARGAQLGSPALIVIGEVVALARAAEHADFQLRTPDVSRSTHMQKMKLVMIGNGMVGQRFLEQLVARSNDFEVTTFCEEPRPAYDRVQLTSFFSGKSAADLNVVPERFFQQHAMTLRLNDSVLAIDAERKVVRSARYRNVPYDKLVIATGSYPFVPPVSGRDRRDCFVYRTIEDLEVITATAARAKVGTVIGGGLLGLEAAKALQDLALETHIVEYASRLMAVQLDDSAGRLLRRKIEALGAKIHLQKTTKEIVDGETRRHKLIFADGTSLETDLIVFSAGIRPRDELARASGLAVGERGGIQINSHCQTTNPDIYAVGECALWEGRIFGLVAPGYQMAEVAARHLVGETHVQFLGADLSTKLKLMGVDVCSIGDAHSATPNALNYVYTDEVAGVYKKLVVSGDRKYLLGAILVGDASDYGTLLQMALNPLPLPEHPEELILPEREGGIKKGLGVDLLPAAALICSCNSVAKGALCDAIAAGATSLGALKKETKASTSCGGCGPLVKQILDCELKKRGVEVKNHLCEHFQYSRQELFHLVRYGNLKTFDAVITKHGQGRGCDICKPAVASIFASCWNEMILQPKHASLQDTNDHFLANLQKNGTYSIIPRVPGGELTPGKLIVLGEVARKFGLYTKITGAQRIDLFGARVEQLPLIWKELIDAGFESGHAYGKALRTVKSCVGSTWCRYGVQDSVAMAINIENRYRGIRSPHKMKMAVSGCTRECAEAQGKDIGVIATEKGWNLYVCGNGGVKPRHADLLARDLDDQTLIKFIDRFLMFYIRTGDRLQRTSTWLENLEGGVDYVRKVVCEDSLGIGSELEADMQKLVDTYECEWKQAINDPEIMKRFRHFVNSGEPDKNVVFVAERGQIRPARPEERESERDAVAV